MKFFYNVELEILMGKIADVLEIKKYDEKLINKYRLAALILNKREDSLADMYKKNKEITIPTLPHEAKRDLEEILEKGHSIFYHELKEGIDDDLLNLLFLPSITAKMISCLYNNFHLNDLDSIVELAYCRKLRKIPVIGVKGEQNLLRGIKLMQGIHKEVSLYIALPLAQRLLGMLQNLPEISNVSTIGSVRRMNEIVHNIDLLVATLKRKDTFDFFARLPVVECVLERDMTHIAVKLHVGPVVKLYAVEPQNYLTALYFYTGTKEYKNKLHEKAVESGVMEEGLGEEDILSRLNLPYIPPELQEGQEILQAIDSGQFPDIINLNDMKGDLHMHTTWSDGASQIVEMRERAISKGYEYIAITDHSQSMVRARGLDYNRLVHQKKEIDKLNQDSDITILHGTEADILKDGTLDFDDRILAELDIVGGSVHTHFRQDERTMTDRLTNALKDPYLTFLSHPTGRLLGRRFPYPLDFDEVVDTAKKMDKFLEINSSPDRLDLNAIMANKAKKAGVPIVINTDAHKKENMDFISFGVTVGRKGWLEKQDVINTLSLQELKERIKKQRKKK